MPWYRRRPRFFPQPARLLLALGAVLLAGLARAQGDCPDGREALQGQSLAEHESWLARFKARCDSDPAFLAWHGAVLNRIGRFDEARAELERALLLEPSLMGARIDYAEALAAGGEGIAARELLQEVRARPDIPPDAAERVQQALRLIDGRADDPRRQTGASATLRIGYDSNLNLATRLDNLSVTLPTGEVVLPLDPKSRARAGASQLLELEGHWTQGGQDGKAVQLFAELHHREAPGADLDYTQIDLSAYWERALDVAQRPLGVAAAAGNLNYGGEEIYRYLRGGLQVPGAGGPCRNLLGADLEWRYHLKYANADYLALYLKSAWVCGNESPFLLQWTLGRENGEQNHPGGNAWLPGVRIAHVRPLGPGQLGTELRYAGRLDDDAYSPLLENGAARRVHTFSLGLEYRYDLDRRWQALVNVEAMRQTSNLELFRLDNVAGYLGLRRHW